jgi:hypothetical protein
MKVKIYRNITMEATTRHFRQMTTDYLLSTTDLTTDKKTIKKADYHILILMTTDDNSKFHKIN